MDIRELHEKYEKLFVKVEGVDLDRFRYVDHKPHIYAVGSKHVDFAVRRFNGKVSLESIRSGEIAGIRCAEPGCNLAYDQHTYDIVCFCKLTKNITGEEFQDRMNFIFKEFEKDKVVRLGFYSNNFNLMLVEP